MKSSIVYIRPLTVAYVREVGPYRRSSRAAWSRIGDILSRKGLRTGAGVGYGLLRDNPRTVAHEALRYDACVVLTAELRDAGVHDLDLQSLPGGAVLRAPFKGPPSGIADVLRHLYHRETESRGLNVDAARPVMEIYPSDPGHLDVAWVKLDLCVPVAV